MKPRIATAIVLFLSSLAFSFNHPELKWQSVTTAHFIIHYYDRTEPAVYATWKIAEESYASLSELYDFFEHDKINIALADYDDYSNGSTDWTNGSIIIWITDARFDLRGNNTWLRNVITHELSHIVTLEKKSKMQLFDWTFAFDYASPRVGVSLAEPFATTRLWPSWLAEGRRSSSRRAGETTAGIRGVKCSSPTPSQTGCNSALTKWDISTTPASATNSCTTRDSHFLSSSSRESARRLWFESGTKQEIRH